MKKLSQHKKVQQIRCKCEFRIATVEHKIQELTNTLAKVMHCLENPHQRRISHQLDQSFESFLLEGLDSLDTLNRMELPNYYSKVELLSNQVEDLEKNVKIIQQMKTNLSMLTKIVDHQEAKLQGIQDSLRIHRREPFSFDKINIPPHRRSTSKGNDCLLSLRDVETQPHRKVEKKQFLSEFNNGKYSMSSCSSENMEEPSCNALNLNFSEITLKPTAQKNRKGV